jgi:hypothetical protein
MFKLLPYIFIFIISVGWAQVNPKKKDTTHVEYFYIEGDSLAMDAIYLDEVRILENLKFVNKDERINYLILKRKTLKVYPYAKLAAERLVELNERLEQLKNKREQRKYAKIVQKYIEEEFSAELKKLTKSEGQILVKLIHRQTGSTAFDLIKQLRSGWKAFWYNNTASLFDISLKKEFNPIDVKEDFFIEDILERAFQGQQLERQKSAFYIDYFSLTDKWLNQPTITPKN